MASKIIFHIFLLIAFSSIASAQDYPATEVYLLSIQKKGEIFSLAENAKPINVSNNKGYDNQPSFIEKLGAIAYVSSRNKKPTDVYLYDISTGTTRQLTNNAEAEFSPKITPDGKFISVVKGAEQNLTRISLNNRVTEKQYTEKLYTCKDSIGYYCWLNDEEIAAVVLSKPESLKRINIKSKTETYLTDSISRSLFKYNDGVLVCRMLHNGNWVTFVDKKGRCSPWIQLPANTEDFFITDDGWLFSSNSSDIVYCDSKDPNKEWKVLADLKPMGISKILRIAVNRKKNRLAFVTNEQ